MSNTWPYRYIDEDRNWLTVDRRDGSAVVQTPRGVAILAEHLPEIVAKLYEAAGLPAPVVLERPKTALSGTHTALGTIYPYKSFKGPHVAVGLRGEDRYLSPAEARETAAALAAYADAIEPEPDPAEVGELAAALQAELYPDHMRRSLPSQSFEDLARAALRWMRDRKAAP